MLQELATFAESHSLDSQNWGGKLALGVLRTRINGMKPYFKLAVVACVVACSVAAYAGSVTTFNFNTNLNGVSSTTVQGTFSYNSATNTFTSAGLTFVGNSIFGGLSGTVTKPQSGTTFVFKQTINGYIVSYTIVFDPLTGSYTTYGSITYGGTTGTFQFNQVPEGGAQLSYLALSGLVLFAGIVLAGKQRRVPAENS
jgi:hypothetical protein